MTNIYFGVNGAITLGTSDTKPATSWTKPSAGKAVPNAPRGRKRTVVIAIVIIVLLLISVIISIARCAMLVRDSHEEELVTNLQVTAQQNAQTIENTLNDQLVLLGGIATETADNLKAGWTTDQLMAMYDSVDLSYSFKRIGFIDTDLNVYTSDGIVRKTDFSDELDKSFAGQCVITAPLKDSYDGSGELVNVFRVPVYENGNEGGRVIGVLFATVSNATFKGMLEVKGFENAGFSCILDDSGNVIDATTESDLDDLEISFIEFMQQHGDDNVDAINEIKSDLASGDSDILRFDYSNGSDQDKQSMYMYHVPLNLGNHAVSWQLAVFVPESYLADQVTQMMTYIYRMLALVLLTLLLVGIVAIIAFWHIRKGNLERLNVYAYNDPLTGGDNFNRFKEVLVSRGTPGALVSIDIDSFKDINSVCGVARGDRILVLIWNAIEGILREDELAARVGGDHFVLFMGKPEGAPELAQGEEKVFTGQIPDSGQEDIAKRLTPITLAMVKISHDLETPLLNPRFGIYPWYPGMDVEESYSRAVSAATHVSANSGNRVAFFSAEDFRKLNEDSATIQAFGPALEAGEFVPYYQPKFSPEGKLVGAEALARWVKPDGTLVPPYKFIPLFEHNGMIRMLDKEIFRQVCEQQEKWMEEGRHVVPVSVNLSRASMHFQGVHEDYVNIIKEIGIAPSLVPIEVTESAIADDRDVSEAIKKFRQSGFPIHMDDFGSGYSSLAALGSMNFDALKLDKSLVDCIGGQSGENLLRHSVQLAQEMQLSVTAEGVERADQVEFLGDLGCNNIQGFYFSRPLPLSEFSDLLD